MCDSSTECKALEYTDADTNTVMYEDKECQTIAEEVPVLDPGVHSLEGWYPGMMGVLISVVLFFV